MRRSSARLVAIILVAWAMLLGAPTPAPTTPDVQAQQAPTGRILAVVGRQVGILNFDAPRPRVLTSFSAPRFAIDLAAVPASTIVAMSVAQPMPDETPSAARDVNQPQLGGDILGLDIGVPDQSPFPLVMRADAGEWLGAPAWLPDASALLFQREDVRAGSDLLAGQAGVRYSSRIEMVNADGTGRRVIVDYGHQPSPSPDGSEIVYVKLSAGGSMLIARNLTTGEDRVLVPAGRLPAIAYPRFDPGGELVVFVAISGTAHNTAPLLFAPNIAYAHGLPWDLWIVGRDGSGLRELAPVGADDASLAWSPDGSEIFVYGSSGARLVDAATGDTEVLTYIAGFGAISWLPGT